MQSKATSTLFAGCEVGGTKCVCVIGTGPQDIRAETRIPTTTPEESISRIIQFLSDAQKSFGPFAALGIATFGPIDLHPNSPTFGFITTTPKPGWTFTDFLGPFKRHFPIPIAFDTDVNGAALGEWRWGAARNLNSFIYLTVGTGIGGGGMMGSRLMHGLIHPEMGHILLRRPTHETFTGICPFHQDCLEGLASGPAIQARWGHSPDSLPPDHPAWTLEAEYLAQALHTFICTLSPQRIILGGGVMQRAHLFPLIRERVRESLNGYIAHPAILHTLDEYIVPPVLGTRSGALGALALAERAAHRP